MKANRAEAGAEGARGDRSTCCVAYRIVSARHWILPLVAVLTSIASAAVAMPPAGHANSQANGFIGVQQTASARADQRALLHALSRGDAARIGRLADKLGLNPVSKALLHAQLDYDMPRVLALAKQCRGNALDQQQWIAAYRCDMLALGAASVLGNAKEIFNAAAWWDARITFPANPHRDGLKTELFGEGFDRADVAKLVVSVPPLSVQVAPQPTPIPIVNWIQRHTGNTKDASGTPPSIRPQVDIRVNGHAVHADIDTGTSLPLTIDISHAKGLDIETLMTGLTASPNLSSPPAKRGNADLGLVANFTFGPLTIHNLAVEVVPDGYAGNGVVVGLPVLARFKQVVFTRSRVLIDSSLLSCRHPLPLTYAAPRAAQLGQLVFATKVDERPVTATFDSGNNSLLTADPALAHESEKASSGVTKGIHLGYLALDVGSGQIASYDAVFLAPWPVPSDVLVGVPLLASADVRLYFSPPSLCIVARHSQPR